MRRASNYDGFLTFGHLLPPSLAIQHLADRRIIPDEVGVVQLSIVANTH
jgi:hypothetical protein